MNRLPYRNSHLLTGLTLGLLSVYCSAPAEPGPVTGSTGGTSPVTGGTTGTTGGATTTTGGTITSTGGTTTSTGGTTTSTGGTTTWTGGTTSSTGGTNTPTGGTGPSTGGSTTTGGTGGGATATGGTNGGSGTNTGGKNAGGTTSTGGKSAGGATTTGGTTSTGGNTSTGGTAGGSTGNFSFFVTSFAAIKRVSGSAMGFGGDLRHGEANGLDGADKICREIAETSMPGAGSKTWRAFLSVKGPPVVNAIDRVGNGPWYDRKGRILAMTKAALAMQRPQGADAAIVNDFPNEDGIPNHNPDGTGNVDNHDMLTGSTTTGTLDMGAGATCTDWTSSEGVSGQRPRVGHSWPAGSGMNWMSALYEGGCAAGVNLVEMGGPKQGEYTVGTGGGYGGFYCFALTP